MTPARANCRTRRELVLRTRCAPPCVARSGEGHKGILAQDHAVPVLYSVIDGHWRIGQPVTEEKVTFAATCQQHRVAAAGIELRSRRRLEGCQASCVIEVRVAVEEDPDVSLIKAQCTKVAENLGGGLHEAAIEDNESSGGGDQEGSDVGGAELIHIPEYPEGWDGLVLRPRDGVCLGGHSDAIVPSRRPLMNMALRSGVTERSLKGTRSFSVP